MGLSPEFARPEWMIMTVLPIPPLAVRPSIQMDGSSTGEDDLTHKLFAIIKTNADVYRCAQDGTPAHLIQQHEQLLQYHVATYMDNDIAGQPPAAHKNGRPVSDLCGTGNPPAKCFIYAACMCASDMLITDTPY